MRAILVLFTILAQVAFAHATPCPEIPRSKKLVVNQATKGYVPVMIELKVLTTEGENQEVGLASLGKFRFWVQIDQQIRYDKYGLLIKAEKCVFPVGPRGLHKLYLTVSGRSQPQAAGETIRTFVAAALLPRSLVQARPTVGAHFMLEGESVPFNGQWGVYRAPNGKTFPTLALTASESR